MTGDPFFDDEDEEGGSAVAVRGRPIVETKERDRLAEPGEQIEPVEIVIERQCRAKRKPCGICGKPKSNAVHHKSRGTCPFKRQNGCANCGLPLGHVDHVGAPESFNVFASGSWQPYQSAKKRWHAVLAPALDKSGLPGGLAHVLVEGQVSFGDGAKRDQGNHRVVIEKALGDVLVQEGYLATDRWHQYEFGGLQLAEDGRNWIRLLLMPRAPADDRPPAQASLLD